MNESENGWSGISSSGSTLLYTWNVPCGARPQDIIRLRVRRGSVGFALCHFAMRWDGLVEDIDGGIPDDWGWAYRPVRGYSKLSNHASGTAIDLDAVRHPLGTDTMNSEDEAIVHRILGAYDGLLRWGGDYHTRLDQMHTELAPGTTIAHAERVARRLMDTRRGKLLLAANPTQKAVILS